MKIPYGYAQRDHGYLCISIHSFQFSAHAWVEAQGGEYPEEAFVAAAQGDGGPIFVARATIDGALTNGMLNPKLPFAQIPHGGREHEIESYEVLVFNSESPSATWVAASNGDLPERAILGGREAKGEPLYVAKALVDGQVSIGKLRPSNGKCYVPHNGKEIVVTSYEVLVASNLE